MTEKFEAIDPRNETNPRNQHNTQHDTAYHHHMRHYMHPKYHTINCRWYMLEYYKPVMWLLELDQRTNNVMHRQHSQCHSEFKYR